MNHTFSDVGVSPQFLLRSKEEATFTYSASNGEGTTFDGRVFLERSENGGLAWETLSQVTAAGYILNTGKQAIYRFRCRYSVEEEAKKTPALEGTVTLAVTELSETVKEILNNRGETVAKVTETGLQVNVLEPENLVISKITSAAVKVTNAATYSILASNSGKLHIIPNLTADCTLTLPAPEAGLNYRFIYGGVAADAQDWTFDTGSDTNFFLGGVTGIDPDDGDVLPIYPDGNSNSIMKIDTPAAGTSVEFYCDGTNWYLNGIVVSATDTHTAFNDKSVE